MAGRRIMKRVWITLLMWQKIGIDEVNLWYWITCTLGIDLVFFPLPLFHATKKNISQLLFVNSYVSSRPHLVGCTVSREPWFLIGAGLTDGLSQFFTPSDKRTSRVSMSSMLSASAKQPVKQPKLAATGSQAAASRLLKKSKLVQVRACGSLVACSPSLALFCTHSVRLISDRPLLACLPASAEKTMLQGQKSCAM